MPDPFFITGLPRSRTAWMAAYLSGGNILCHHELMKYCPTKQAFFANLHHPEYRIGTSDSGLPFAPFQQVYPEAKTVIIERAIADVHQSLHDIEIPVGMDFLEDLQSRLDELEGLRVPFDELDDRLPEVCEHLEIPYNRVKHGIFRSLVVVTVDFTPDNYSIWR